MSIFERATRNKIRFSCKKGLLSAEDLFDLSLTSLDTIAKDVNKQIKAEAEESFIEVKSRVSSDLELQLDILKFIIADKLATQEANRKRAETNAKKSQIEDIILRKKSQELEDLPVEELEKMLAQ